MPWHKIQDPIHAFIKFSDEEKAVLDSWPLQRLRYIRQNALAYLVYPGVTHSRFEHSLGVMELAGRAFDVITAKDNRLKRCERFFPENASLPYWREVVRMAALCHDIGHVPFSHALEESLLPSDVNHETLTIDVIHSPEMQKIWQRMPLAPKAEHIAKLATGPKHFESELSDWQRILSEIITGDVFGVDRMDYLLRDSHYSGLAYGRFDHYRLIDTLRVVPYGQLGIEEGGLRSAEDLLLSRYFMFKQLYFHSVCRVYSLHLADFLKPLVRDESSPLYQFHLMTDSDIIAEMIKADKDNGHPSHRAARCILRRQHDKLLFTPNNGQRGEDVYKMALEEFGAEVIRRDVDNKTGKKPRFFISNRSGGIECALEHSTILSTLPLVDVDYLFVKREKFEEAAEWLNGALH